jgi:hypothetical protein
MLHWQGRQSACTARVEFAPIRCRFPKFIAAIVAPYLGARLDVAKNCDNTLACVRLQCDDEKWEPLFVEDRTATNIWSVMAFS